MATFDNLIQVRDLKKYYNGESIKALDGVSIDVNRGDVMVIIGPSGSGKSTFLRSLNLLEVPTPLFLKVSISPRKKARMEKSWTSTCIVRRWGWFFSISTFSLIRQFCRI